MYFKHLLFDFPCGAACAAEVCHQDAIEARALRELSSACFAVDRNPRTTSLVFTSKQLVHLGLSEIGYNTHLMVDHHFSP